MELNLSQGYPENFSKLNENQIKEIIDWELSVFENKEISIDYISDNIFIGNYSAALNRNSLKANNITHIIVAGKDMIDLYRDQLTYKILPLYDSPYLKLKKYFSEVNLFINSVRMVNNNNYFSLDNKDVNNILIHCGSGISRSVSLVIAYFIAEKKMSYEEAKNHVKSKRKIANPNGGFEKELREYSYNINKRF